MEKVKEAVHKVTHPKEHTSTSNTYPTDTTTGGTHHHGGAHHEGGTHHQGAHGIDGSHSNTHAGHGHSSATGTAVGSGTQNTAGPHRSDVLNKTDPRVDSDRDGSTNLGAARHGPGADANAGYGGQQSSTIGNNSGQNTAGPHRSDMLNKADPRVDSDRDGSTNLGAARHGPGAVNANSGYEGQQNSTFGTNSGQNTAGPHRSDLLNKTDPRVDSDRDGSRNMGAAQYGPGATNTNTNSGFTNSNQPGHSSGFANSNEQGQQGYNNSGRNEPVHSSNLANKIDPRVDTANTGYNNQGVTSSHQPQHAGYGNEHSGLGNTQQGGYGNESSGLGHRQGGFGNESAGLTSSHQPQQGAYGNEPSGLGNTQQGGYGNESSGLGNTQQGGYGNQSSGLTGSHHPHQAGYASGGTGTSGGYGLDGPAPNTAGPHKSDMLNKVDPRIDSDRDGSKTMGGNPQY